MYSLNNSVYFVSMHTFLKKIIQDMSNGLFIVVMFMTPVFPFLYLDDVAINIISIILWAIAGVVAIGLFGKTQYRADYSFGVIEIIETLLLFSIIVCLIWILWFVPQHPNYIPDSARYGLAIEQYQLDLRNYWKIVDLFLIALVTFFSLSGIRRLYEGRRSLFAFFSITIAALVLLGHYLDGHYLDIIPISLLLMIATWLLVAFYFYSSNRVIGTKRARNKFIENSFAYIIWIISGTSFSGVISTVTANEHGGTRGLELLLGVGILIIGLVVCPALTFFGYYLGEHILHKGRISPEKVKYWLIAAVVIPLIPIVASPRLWKLIASALV